MNKKLILPIFAFFIVILIVFLYRRNKSVVAKTLAKFNLQAMTFDNTAGIEEGKKMTSPEMLKNTIMSLKQLKNINTIVLEEDIRDKNNKNIDKYEMYGVGINNNIGGIDIKRMDYDGGNNPIIYFATQDGIYTKIVAYNYKNNTSNAYYYEGLIDIIHSDKMPALVNGGDIYKIRRKISNSDIYPNIIREGLFFIKLGDSFVVGVEKGDTLLKYRTDDYQVRANPTDQGSCCGGWGGDNNPEFLCSNGSYVDEVYGRAGNTIDRIGMKCSNQPPRTDWGTSYGGWGGNDFSKTAPQGFSKIEIRSGSKVDSINLFSDNNNTYHGWIGGGGGDGPHRFDCGDGKLMGMLARTGNRVDRLTVICGKNIKVSEDTARTEFVNSKSSIENYKKENPVPFLLSYIGGSGNNIEFNLYDVTGKTYELSQYKNLGKVNLEIKNNKIFLSQNGKYLYSDNSYIKQADINEKDDRFACELVSVLDPEKLAPKYLQATYNYFNTRGVDRSTLNKLCGSSPKFPDGTLKIYPSSMGKDDKGLLSDPIARAFESICACNMDDDFYRNLLCSDKLIKENFGIDPVDPKNKDIVSQIRANMRCTYPTCTFEKCRNLIGKTNDYVYNEECGNKLDCVACGSGVICISNQNINIGENAVLENTQISAQAKLECGGKSIPKPKVADIGDFKWLDPANTKIGKDVQCVIENDGKNTPVDASTPGCEQLSSKVYIDVASAEKSIDKTADFLRTIIIRGVITKDLETIDNSMKELLYEKFKTEYSLPSISDVSMKLENNRLIITHYVEEEVKPTPEPATEPVTEPATEPTTEPATELTPSKKSNNNMIYIIILVLLILGAGGYFIMKK